MNFNKTMVILMFIAFLWLFSWTFAAAIQRPARQCDCTCEPTRGLVLPADTPTVEEWLQWME